MRRVDADSPKRSGRILFFDDEIQIAALTRELLTREGYDVTAFSDPVEGVVFFCSNRTGSTWRSPTKTCPA